MRAYFEYLSQDLIEKSAKKKANQHHLAVLAERKIQKCILPREKKNKTYCQAPSATLVDEIFIVSFFSFSYRRKKKCRFGKSPEQP